MMRATFVRVQSRCDFFLKVPLIRGWLNLQRHVRVGRVGATSLSSHLLT